MHPISHRNRRLSLICLRMRWFDIIQFRAATPGSTSWPRFHGQYITHSRALFILSRADAIKRLAANCEIEGPAGSLWSPVGLAMDRRGRAALTLRREDNIEA